MVDWSALPRVLWDLCDGHPGYAEELYALDTDRVRFWLCKSCYVDAVVRRTDGGTARSTP